MNTNRYEIQDQGADQGSERFRVFDTKTGVVANWFGTREAAESAITASGRPSRRTSSQRAWDRGQSYGVNGQIWDEDI